MVLCPQAVTHTTILAGPRSQYTLARLIALFLTQACLPSSHWPDCNWCNSKGSTNIVAPGNGADGDSDEFDPSEPDYYDDGGDWGNYAADNE
ncbi:hypothetical protein FA95DRAFT_1181722 [Auriscalpium vulgare]|uniref:Uncharacterized protein n=1 Tax=Auriscalpium vulgare TaxID=40419 RepID=A0ACB8S9C9_9AGAM|nr:hypothetical protein FA95DRAFT_1181722 [Auriscalpium vulgare]